MNINKLDNPVYNSLLETHNRFAISYDNAKFYHPDYCAFGGFIGTTISSQLLEYALLSDDFYVVGDKPDFNNNLTIVRELICNQMILEKPVENKIDVSIISLNKDHAEDLFELVNKVQPGYFKSKTNEMGSYYGIYMDGNLIAAAGERMKMNEFTELSAIVTHLEHTGKGYATQLIAYLTDKIFSEGKTPYLHVANTNLNAIKLYEKLGFTIRRKISFWNLVTTSRE